MVQSRYSPLQSTDVIPETLLQSSITHKITHFGLPVNLSSDIGDKFTSETWSTIAQLFGSKIHFTAVYYPQDNGTVECFHR